MTVTVGKPVYNIVGVDIQNIELYKECIEPVFNKSCSLYDNSNGKLV